MQYEDWQAYRVAPIDSGWEYLKTVRETLAEMANLDFEAQFRGDIASEEIQRFIAGWQSAKNAARELGWEGDFRHEPCVFWLPAVPESDFGFVFKQDNNGTTFVLSPRALPYLEEDAF